MQIDTSQWQQQQPGHLLQGQATVNIHSDSDGGIGAATPQQALGTAVTAAAPAEPPSPSPDPPKPCSELHDKEQCAVRKGECVWCQNTYSPMPGSEGVCVDPEQAKYLPKYAYDCEGDIAKEATT